MSDLRRNNQDVWICSIIDEIEIQDEYGDYTGAYRKVISKPTKYRLGVGPSIGDATFTPYGANLQYNREISTRKKSIVINEGDLLFVDVIPLLDEDGSLKLNEDNSDYVTPPDYLVKSKLYSQKEKYVRYGLEKR